MTLTLRTVWPKEEQDFSKWLVKENNLMLLSDAIDIDIVFEERESSVGAFSADVFATEKDTSRKIIIENQLEETNHDHLGKIITYAFGKNADVIIWIVKKARDEHKQAIEWLNQHTDDNIGFFLVEIQLWKIDNSKPAPKFNVVESPNDWAKTMKATESLSGTQKIQLAFWQSFNDYAVKRVDFSNFFNTRKAQPHNWYDLSVGSSIYRISLTAGTQKKKLGIAIYIVDDKEIYKKYVAKKAEIENELGISLEWIEAIKDCRILAQTDGDINEAGTAWETYFDWYCNMAIKLRNIVKKYGF